MTKCPKQILLKWNNYPRLPTRKNNTECCVGGQHTITTQQHYFFSIYIKCFQTVFLSSARQCITVNNGNKDWTLIFSPLAYTSVVEMGKMSPRGRIFLTPCPREDVCYRNTIRNTPYVVDGRPRGGISIQRAPPGMSHEWAMGLKMPDLLTLK